MKCSLPSLINTTITIQRVAIKTQFPGVSARHFNWFSFFFLTVHFNSDQRHSPALGRASSDTSRATGTHGDGDGGRGGPLTRTWGAAGRVRGGWAARRRPLVGSRGRWRWRWNTARRSCTVKANATMTTTRASFNAIPVNFRRPARLNSTLSVAFSFHVKWQDGWIIRLPTSTF